MSLLGKVCMVSENRKWEVYLWPPGVTQALVGAGLMRAAFLPGRWASTWKRRVVPFLTSVDIFYKEKNLFVRWLSVKQKMQNCSIEDFPPNITPCAKSYLIIYFKSSEVKIQLSPPACWTRNWCFPLVDYLTTGRFGRSRMRFVNIK